MSKIAPDSMSLTRLLLEAIHPRIGTLASREEQDSFLDDFIQQQGIKNQTHGTLRKRLGDAISKNRRGDHPDVRKPVTEHVFLYRAETIFTQAYLTRIGFAVPKSTSTKAKSGVNQATAQDGERDLQISQTPGESGPSKRKAATELDRDASPKRRIIEDSTSKTTSHGRVGPSNARITQPSRSTNANVIAGSASGAVAQQQQSANPVARPSKRKAADELDRNASPKRRTIDDSTSTTSSLGGIGLSNARNTQPSQYTNANVTARSTSGAVAQQQQSVNPTGRTSEAPEPKRTTAPVQGAKQDAAKASSTRETANSISKASEATANKGPSKQREAEGKGRDALQSSSSQSGANPLNNFEPMETAANAQIQALNGEIASLKAQLAAEKAERNKLATSKSHVNPESSSAATTAFMIKNRFGKSIEEFDKEDRYLMNLQYALRNSMSGDMSSAYEEVRQAVAAYWDERGLNRMALARFVDEPSPKLEKLYKAMFGDDNWKQGVVNIHETLDPTRGRYRADRIVMALVAAEIHEKIFSQKTVFNLQEKVDAALGPYADIARQTVNGHRFERILDETQLHMISDKAFKEKEVAPYARGLAEDLALTLEPHMALWRQSVPSGQIKPVNPKEWVDGLADAFVKAIMFKTQLDVMGRRQEMMETYEFVWLKHGDLVEEDTATPMEGLSEKIPTAAGHRIMLTMWPGLRLTQPLRDNKTTSFFSPLTRIMGQKPETTWAERREE